MKENTIRIRLATLADISEIEAMMKRSMSVLGRAYYSKKQIEACCQFVCIPDCQLIEDKTFFVAIDTDEKIIGCGGWSLRNKLCSGPKEHSQNSAKLNPLRDPAPIRAMFVDPLFSGKGIGSKILEHSEMAAKESGFSKGILMATLSGAPFYKAKKWLRIAEKQTILANGVSIGVVHMEKNLSQG